APRTLPLQAKVSRRRSEQAPGVHRGAGRARPLPLEAGHRILDDPVEQWAGTFAVGPEGIDPHLGVALHDDPAGAGMDELDPHPVDPLGAGTDAGSAPAAVDPLAAPGLRGRVRVG